MFVHRSNQFYVCNGTRYWTHGKNSTETEGIALSMIYLAKYFLPCIVIRIVPNICSSNRSKLLTMDVIELTLLLKSIGFRLDSIDYDELRSWGKKMTENGTGRADADHHSIDVQISCSKSKIVSHLSFKLNENEIGAAAATDPVKSMACSCPKREPRSDNNSFWEVQSSGTFANQRRSINALIVSKFAICKHPNSWIIRIKWPFRVQRRELITTPRQIYCRPCLPSPSHSLTCWRKCCWINTKATRNSVIPVRPRMWT